MREHCESKKNLIVTGDLEKLIGGRINCPQVKGDFDHLKLGAVKMPNQGDLFESCDGRMQYIGTY